MPLHFDLPLYERLFMYVYHTWHFSITQLNNAAYHTDKVE